MKSIFHRIGTWFAASTLMSAGVFLSLVAIDAAPQNDGSLPLVTSASIPIYPPLARMARIEGTVRIRISTNGSAVSKVEIESGQPLLAKASEENVKTWRFQKHSPTTFKVTFQYHMTPESLCEIDNPIVTLRLPSSIEIVAKGVRTCDPAQVR